MQVARRVGLGDEDGSQMRGAVDQSQGESEEHRAPETEDGAKTAPGSDQPTSRVNVLGTNLIRKKKKT